MSSASSAGSERDMTYNFSFYHEGGGLEQQFQYLAEEVADAFLHVVHSPVDIHPRHRHHVGGRPAEFLQLLVKLLALFLKVCNFECSRTLSVML